MYSQIVQSQPNSQAPTNIEEQATDLKGLMSELQQINQLIDINKFLKILRQLKQELVQWKNNNAEICRTVRIETSTSK